MNFQFVAELVFGSTAFNYIFLILAMKHQSFSLACLFTWLLVLAVVADRTGTDDIGEQRSSDKLIVDYVTDRLNGYRGSFLVGVEGGTTLYIYGSGFDATPQNNKVNLGGFPCIVNEDGASQHLLICTTSKATDLSVSFFTVTVGKKVFSISSGLWYNPFITPEITGIVPRSPSSGQIISLLGVHRVNYATNISWVWFG